MSWDLFLLLLQASVTTIVVSVVSIVLGFLLATVVCAGTMSSNGLARGAGRLFVSFFRGTPLLVQLLLIYHLLPQIGLDVPSEVAAVAGMALCTAAYQAEILRGGFGAVPKGLMEAADMCGLGAFATFRRIRLPIAVRLTLPSLVSEIIMILKASSLVSVVGVIELTRMTQDLAASTFLPLPLYASAGVIYLAINAVIAGVGTVLERRVARGHA
jgi:polar amino acid transport system permease protein